MSHTNKKFTIKEPLVSIIINCYNGEKYLKEAIDSVLDQTYHNWEIIFWDNQSTDKSAKIFNTYKDKRLKYYYSQKHTLLYEARNLALKKSKGEFIAFLDVDDWWHSDKLKKQIPLFTDKNVGLVFGNFWQIKNRYKKVKQMYRKTLPRGWVLNSLLNEYVIGLLTIVVRKKALDTLSYPFDSRYHVCGDFDLSIRLSVKWKFDRIQEPIAFYRLHGNNESILQKERHIKEMESWYSEKKSIKSISSQKHFSKILENIIIMKVIQNVKTKNPLKQDVLMNKIPMSLKKMGLIFSNLIPKFILQVLISRYDKLILVPSLDIKKIKFKNLDNIKNLKVLHIITGLSIGGAETVLYRLVTSDNINKHHVISMIDKGVHGKNIAAAKIPLFTLGMPRGIVRLQSLLKLYSYIKKINPDIVQTWMYHADLGGGIIARIAGVKSIIWSVRNNNLDKDRVSARTRLIVKVCSYLSKLIPKKIISNSNRAASFHKNIGYDKNKIVVINNGYDFNQFKEDTDLRKKTRIKLGIKNDEILLGTIARWDPLKDHENLISSLSLINKSIHRKWRIILVGPNMNNENILLNSLLIKYNLKKQVMLLGSKNNTVSYYNAMDIHILSSAGEAFPNVLAESMACGTPCITTDVGDASQIVSDLGWVVPPKNNEALASAIKEAIELFYKDKTEWNKRKKRSTQHILSKYKLNQMVNNFNKVWASVYQEIN